MRENRTTDEKDLCQSVLDALNDRFTHMVYVFAKALLAEQQKAAGRRKDA